MTYKISHDPAAGLWIVSYDDRRLGVYEWLCDAEEHVASARQHDAIVEAEAALIDAVRAHANANYETDGWDLLVECWDDADIVYVMGDARTAEDAIARVAHRLRTVDDHRRDIIAEAGE